MSDRYKIGSCH